MHVIQQQVYHMHKSSILISMHNVWLNPVQIKAERLSRADLQCDQWMLFDRLKIKPDRILPSQLLLKSVGFAPVALLLALLEQEVTLLNLSL